MTDVDSQPMIELIKADGSKICIWANGKVDGFDGVIVNRFPQIFYALVDTISNGVIGFGNDIKEMKDMVK